MMMEKVSYYSVPLLLCCNCLKTPLPKLSINSLFETIMSTKILSLLICMSEKLPNLPSGTSTNVHRVCWTNKIMIWTKRKN